MNTFLWVLAAIVVYLAGAFGLMVLIGRVIREADEREAGSSFASAVELWLAGDDRQQP